MRVLAVICAVSALLCACSEFKGFRAPNDELYFPVGVALHPNGRFAYVANSNFDAQFRPDIGGTVSVVDLTTMQVIPEATLEIGSFAGDLVLNQGRDGASDPDRLYIAVRGDNSVVALAVSEDGSSITCPRSPGAEDALDCRIEDVAEDPFTLTMLPRPGDAREGIDLFAVAGIDGYVSYVALDTFAVEDAAIETVPVVSGASAIAYFANTDEVWVAGRFSRRIRGLTAVLAPSPSPSQQTNGEVLEVYVSTEAFVPSTNDITEVRDIAFSADGERAYISTNTPSAFIVLDMTQDSEGDAHARVMDRFDADGAPAQFALIEENGREVIYAALASAEGIGVYDAATGTLLDTITMDGVAYGLAFDPATLLLYATIFDVHRLVAIDVDPASATFRTVVGRTP